MNIFDKTVSFFSPSHALKRVEARRKIELLNNYANHGANTRKKSMIGWQTSSGSVIEDIENNVNLLRERSRDLYAGAPIATGALKTLRTNVVGTGLKLNAQIDYEFLGLTEEEADKWETNVEREFSLWAESIHCDAQRMNNFYELQQLVFLSWLMNGDCFVMLPMRNHVNMPYDLRIKVIEADRVSNPDKAKFDEKIINGVEVDDFGEVVAYHVSKYHPYSMNYAKNEWKRIEKFGRKSGRQNIIHIMESERPEQRRGIPILAPVIESIKQLSRYTEAELIAAVVSGLYTIFITKDLPDSNDELSSIGSGELIDSDDDSTIEMGPGSIQYLDDGEKVQESNPGRPNTAFDGFVTSVCRQIGAALEIPYELLLKNFTASYSASRGALLEAWKMFRMRRTWLSNDLCNPIYEEFIAEGVAKGRIVAPGFFTDPLIRKAYCKCEWNGPSQGQIDPWKEVNAAIKRVENGFSTNSKETVELTGGDWFANVRLRATEEKTKEQYGLKEEAKISNK